MQTLTSCRRRRTTHPWLAQRADGSPGTAAAWLRWTIIGLFLPLVLAASLPASEALEQRPAEDGQEQVDSGWVIASPLTTHYEVSHRPSVDRTVVEHLRGVRTPVLAVPSIDSDSAENHQHVARRPAWQTPMQSELTSSANRDSSWISSQLADLDLRNANPTPTPAAPLKSRDQHLDADVPASRADAIIQFRSPSRRPVGLEIGTAGQYSGQDFHDDSRSVAELFSNPGGGSVTGDGPLNESGSPATAIRSKEAVETPARQQTAEVHDHAEGLGQHDGSGPGKISVDAAPTMTSTGQESPPHREPTRIDESQDRSSVVAEPRSTLPLKPLMRSETRLRIKTRRVLKMYYKRPLNSRDHDPWEVMHGMLAYGLYSRVLQNGPHGSPVTAVGWLCYNRPCKGKVLLYQTNDEELRARWGVGVQGHYGQFLAMLAQCRVAAKYPIRIGASEYAIQDLIEAEKATCQSGEELSFKLIALMHYCRSDESWLNEQGSQWDIPRLIHEELEQPIRGAPCGGTHRLAGLSLAAKTRVKRGEPLDGEYRRAREFVEKYHRYTLKLQNSDGSLSTNWFRGPGDEEDINRRIKTTGHILEWLIYSLDESQLRDWPVIRAVDYVADLLYRNYDHDWEIGPLCHAIHALVLYDERVYQKLDGMELAGNSTRSTGNRQLRQTNDRNMGRSSRR